MLKVASFALPAEQKKANEFLATHKISNTNFNKDMIVVFAEDGVISAATQVADLQGIHPVHGSSDVPAGSSCSRHAGRP